MEKKLRLRDSKDYRRVYKRGRRVWNRTFTIFVTPTRSECPRVGFSITKKFGTAVERNRMRRRLKEVIRQHRAAIPRMDIIVMPKRSALTLPFELLTRELLGVMGRTEKRTKR